MRKVFYISLRQLPPRLVRVLLVYIYINPIVASLCSNLLAVNSIYRIYSIHLGITIPIITQESPDLTDVLITYHHFVRRHLYNYVYIPIVHYCIYVHFIFSKSDIKQPKTIEQYNLIFVEHSYIYGDLT